MADYSISFEKGSSIWKLYQELKKNGVKDSDLDKGYPETDYVKRERKVVHQADHKIQPEEVLDYALERYSKYQLAIKETTGYDVPWSLDDLDPRTSFDEEIRQRVNQTIAACKQILASKGLKKGTDKFNESLGLSLYAFVLSTVRKNGDIIEFVLPKSVRAELASRDLNEMISYLSENMGLGLTLIRKDCSFESSALEALKNNCGNCTEKSSILYTIFQMAGLDAKFTHVLPSYDFLQKNRIDLGSLHTSISLKIGHSQRIFDINLAQSNAERFYMENNFIWWFPETTREFLAAHHTNLGLSYISLNGLDLAIIELKKAIAIDPGFAPAHSSLGVAYYKKRSSDLAIAEHKESIRIDPASYIYHNNLAAAYNQKGNADLAFAEAKKALAVYPLDADAHHNLGDAYYKKNEFDLAATEYQKAIAIKPNPAAHLALGVTYFHKKEWNLAATEFQAAIALNPNEAMSHFNLGALYIQMGDPDLAISELEKAIALKPGFTGAQKGLEIALKQKAKKPVKEEHKKPAWGCSCRF
jgi:tetratricopeptide (TPR) repeat protein